MDPDQARLLLTDAAFVELFINSRAAPIYTLTAYELELLKENNLKSTEAQIARKYHKIMALLSELQPLLTKEHTMKAKAPKSKKTRRQPDITGGDEPSTPLPTTAAPGGAQWQLVPYVPHTPPRPPSISRPSFLPSPSLPPLKLPAIVVLWLPWFLKCYRVAATLVCFIVLGLPLALFVGITWSVIALCLHILLRPEILITGSFNVAWAVPE